jgi:hypothetical protein
MEWQIPIQKLEIGNINIGSPWAREKKEYYQKPMAPLSYFGTQFRLPFVSLLFPPLPIVEYNPHTSKLVIDMAETNLGTIKLNTFQETLINSILYHQSGWFQSSYTKDQIKEGFQPIIENSHIHLHCPSKGVPLYKNDEWIQANMTDLKPGQKIRVAVKIHGISFLNKKEYTPRVSSQESALPKQDDASSRMHRESGTKGQTEWSGKCRIQHRIQGIILQK